MNKNKLYQHFSFSVNRYAPEQFMLFYKDIPVKLTDQERYDMGYTAITAGKWELLKLIKQWVRKHSIFSKEIKHPILAIVSQDNSEYYHIGLTVDRYNITEKINVYKWIKEIFNAGQFAIKTTSAKLDENFKPYDVQEKQVYKKLGERVIFI